AVFGGGRLPGPPDVGRRARPDEGRGGATQPSAVVRRPVARPSEQRLRLGRRAPPGQSAAHARGRRDGAGRLGLDPHGFVSGHSVTIWVAKVKKKGKTSD